MIMHSSKCFPCHIKLQKTMIIIIISVLDIIHYVNHCLFVAHYCGSLNAAFGCFGLQTVYGLYQSATAVIPQFCHRLCLHTRQPGTVFKILGARQSKIHYFPKILH